MSPPPVRLRMQAQSTTLAFVDGRVVALPVGPQGLAEAALRHDPPTPVELERAIDLIEDAVAGSRVADVDRGDLATADPFLRALPGLGSSGSVLGRDAVERLFERLAARAHGMPVAGDELPHGRDIAAALLILRECMHHLDFRRVAAAP